MGIDFNSILASAGSVLSGVVRVATWLLAAQGLLLGLIVLFYGRRAFWVFASVFGFVLGLSLATNFGAGLPPWAQPVLAVVLGGAGAAVAFKAPRPIAATIGGLLLALLGYALLASGGLPSWLHILIAVAAGILGFYLFWRVLDWALIVATSLLGAGIAALSLTSLFGFARVFGALPFALLLVAGIVYQRRDQVLAATLKRALAKPGPADSSDALSTGQLTPAALAAGVVESQAPQSSTGPDVPEGATIPADPPA